MDRPKTSRSLGQFYRGRNIFRQNPEKDHISLSENNVEMVHDL